MQEIGGEIVNRTIASFLFYVPELALCVVAILLIICNLFRSRTQLFFYISLIGIVVHTVLLLTDTDLVVIKVVMAMATLVTLLMSAKQQRMEYYLLIITALLGADILAMGRGFIMILLSMELISLSSYVLTAGTEPDKRRAEAAWKFFLYGSVATAIMIFGMTYVYGDTGDLSFPGKDQNSNLATVGGLMVLAGFLFKMTAAPLHLWAPDVYEATPAPVVAFLSVVPKLAAFAIVLKTVQWTSLIAIVAIFSIILGTLAALNQSNAKRMMAYSSVAQAGFLLAIAAIANVDVAVFYAIVFMIMNYVVFIAIDAQERSGGGTAFADFDGLGYTNPLAAVAATLGLISLAGIPPVAGFMAKLMVFSGVWTAYSESNSFIFLALFVIGLLATVASLFFYLKIPFHAFFRRTDEKPVIKIDAFTNLLLVILVGLLLTLFMAPGLFDGLSY